MLASDSLVIYTIIVQRDRKDYKDMKLYACIQNREAGHEWVVLCQFKNDEGDIVFVESVERHNEEMFKVLIDEGFSKTEYFYPVKNFSITHLEKYE